jgi:hypothetical protein
MHLRKRGLDEARAWQSASNGRGPWWNAGASHMHDAYRKAYFDKLGWTHWSHCLHSIAAYGTLREPTCTETYARWCGSCALQAR